MIKAFFPEDLPESDRHRCYQARGVWHIHIRRYNSSPTWVSRVTSAELFYMQANFKELSIALLPSFFSTVIRGQRQPYSATVARFLLFFRNGHPLFIRKGRKLPILRSTRSSLHIIVDNPISLLFILIVLYSIIMGPACNCLG